MAKKNRQPVNKSAFVRDFITENPEANRKAVEGAWLAAGHDGAISSALVSNIRARMGLTGNAKDRPEAASTSAAERPGKPGGAAGKGRGGKPEQPRAEANGATAAFGSQDEPLDPAGRTAMAPGRGGNQGKTAFVTERLRRDPGATDVEITEAWTAAGNDGGISGSLIYKIRAKEGLTGKRGTRGRGAGRKGRAGSSPRAVGAHDPAAGASRPLDKRTNRGRVLAELEGDIDRLIFKLMGVGGLEEIEDDLRKVRRRLVLGQGE